MSLLIACPDRAGLQALIDSTLPEADAAEITAHIDTCEHCQHALEEIAGHESVLPGASRSRVIDRESMDTTLRRAVRQLKSETELADSGTDEAEPAAPDDLSLEFLDPANKPGCLGRLSHYEVTEVIGRGGMGVVFKAFDPPLNRFVAIKVLAPQLATSAAARKRFAREAKAAAAINHDHVVAVHAVDEWKGLPYLVMQYISGISLQERLDREGPLELKEILRIGMQVASGLAAAHDQGLVHRDIKPANILLENGVERVKVTDLGLARAVDDASLTRSGFVAGTPQYMAPEQAAGEPIDHRADLFSLGSVLYALATGRPPFRAENAMAVLRRVCDESPRRVSEINPDIPDWLADIIEKLHAKNPTDRFQSAAEIAELLRQHLAHLQQPTIVPQPPGLKPHVRSPQPHHGNTRRWLAAAVVLLIVAGFGFSQALGVTSLSELVGQIVRVVTPRGTLVIETDDPAINITVDGETVTIDGTGLGQLTLRPGSHHVQATKDGTLIHNEPVTISRGGRQVVKVTLQPPEMTDIRKPQDNPFVTPRHTTDQRAPRNDVTVYAPEDGVVTDVLVDHSQQIRQGDVLLRLRNASLELEHRQRTGALEEAKTRIAVAEKQRDDSPLDQLESAKAAVELARRQLKALEERLDVLLRLKSLEVPAPTGGVVATWEPKRKLVNRPVKAGEALLVISEIDSDQSAGDVKEEVLPYIVREGDTLSGIARQHLGNANRWREIFGLNRDKLSESNELKVGMELQLSGPGDGGASHFTSRLDRELGKAVDRRIVQVLPVTKDCMVLSHIPEWAHGDVDNIGVESGGVRTLVNWQPIPSEEDRRTDRRFLLALYSRRTLWNPPDDTIVACEISTDWPERTSWKTQPRYGTALVAQFKLSSGVGWKLFDITPLIREQSVQKQKGFGVMFRFADEDLQLQKQDFSTYQFVSREGDGEWLSGRPLLLIVEPN